MDGPTGAQAFGWTKRGTALSHADFSCNSTWTKTDRTMASHLQEPDPKASYSAFVQFYNHWNMALKKCDALCKSITGELREQC